jgi:Rrf2 family protein
MNHVLKISEASSLALHTMIVLSENTDKLVSTKDIALTLKVSEAHLSKVLQRLTKVGMVSAVRGPRGGFKLGKQKQEICSLDVYEAIEGSIAESTCLFVRPVCKGKECILGDLLSTVNHQLKKQLKETRLSDFNGANGDKRFEFLQTGKDNSRKR